MAAAAPMADMTVTVSRQCNTGKAQPGLTRAGSLLNKAGTAAHEARQLMQKFAAEWETAAAAVDEMEVALLQEVGELRTLQDLKAGRLTLLEAKVEKQKQTLDALTGASGQLKTENVTLANEKSQLVARVTALEQENGWLREDKKELKANAKELGNLVGDLPRWRHTNRRLARKMEELETSLLKSQQDQGSQDSDRQQRLSTLITKMRELRSVGEAQQTKLEATEAISIHASTILHLQAVMSDLQRDNALLEHNVYKTAMQTAAMEPKLAGQHVALDAAHVRLGKWKAHAGIQDKKISSLKRRRDTLQKECERMSKKPKTEYFGTDELTDASMPLKKLKKLLLAFIARRRVWNSDLTAECCLMASQNVQRMRCR